MASPDSVVEFRLLRNFEAEQGNMLFEKALAECNKDTQDRWCNVANKVVGGKSAEEFERHHENLVQDQPNYMATGSNAKLKRKWNC
ncbi:hypothetical protein ACLB2K_057127 [Fragaria x ananassa]